VKEVEDKLPILLDLLIEKEQGLVNGLHLNDACGGDLAQIQ